MSGTCPNCGGMHFGTFGCPYIKAPCVVCGADTVLACADCGINSGGKSVPHVCSNSACRDQHEATHAAQPDTDKGE